MVVLLARAAMAAPQTTEVSTDAAALPGYDELKADLAARRDWARTVWELDPREGLIESRAAFVDVVKELLPPWVGTPWAMNGTSEVPGEGRIACGYFVSTVLRDAGLAVDRVKLAQQASEDIVRTLVDEEGIARYWHTGVADVLRDQREDGVYVVGLDTHVGLLVVDDGIPTFCHASQTLKVVCEPAEDARALRSRYLVIGRLSDRVVEAWVTGAEVPTVTD